AKNIVATLRGEKPQPFVFTPIGELALVGRHSGVAKIYGRHFSGFLAWAMWRAIYLSKMPGMGQRSRILLDWILDFIFGRSIAELSLNASKAPAIPSAASQ
ncbi:MAG: NAD(P)/FAD-dependent oxidoreductase, partial [Bryobacteraceae bacterium]